MPTTTPRKSAATRRAEATAADAVKLAAQTGQAKPETAAATRALTAAEINEQNAAARLAQTRAINGAGGTGRTVTGADDQKGRGGAKPASTVKPATSKPARTPKSGAVVKGEVVATDEPKAPARGKAKGSTTAKPGAELERTDLAAEPVRIRTSSRAKREGPTDTDLKRVVAARVVAGAAKMLSSWPEKTTGVTKAQAEEWVAKWLQYLPVTDEDWPEAFGPKSGAGRKAKGATSSEAA